MEPLFFKAADDFRAWLEINYKTSTELLVAFYKTSTGKQSITWPESVDQALCFGWIDGVRKSLGEESYTIRFTPRKPGSIWSAVNINKMEDLLARGLVKPEGIAAFEKRTEAKSKIYSHERTEEAVLPAALEERFKSETAAWDYFIKQAPSYKKVVIHWIISAKQDKTKTSRFEKLLEASKEGKRLA